jgi:hypothetical protein
VGGSLSNSRLRLSVGATDYFSHVYAYSDIYTAIHMSIRNIGLGMATAKVGSNKFGRLARSSMWTSISRRRQLLVATWLRDMIFP